MAFIESGPAKGKGCYVAHKKPDFSDGKIIIRIDEPMVGSNQDFTDRLAGYFITRKVPKDFTYAKSHEVILYGFVPDKLRGNFPAPAPHEIIEFFNPGSMAKILHYSKGGLFIHNYEVSGFNPKKTSKISQKTTKLFDHSIGGVLKKYLAWFKENSELSDCPRIVTLDKRLEENLDFNCVIEPEFQATGLKYIEMESQQIISQQYLDHQN